MREISEENKPKILFFITKSVWGGAQKYVYDLSTDLELQKKYHTIVALGGTGILSEKLAAENIEIINAKYLKNTLNPITLFYSIIENIKIIRNVKPEIVHTNSSFAGLSIGFACLLLRQKSVFTVHGWPQNEDRNLFMKITLGQCMAAVVLFHSKYISVSKKVLQQTPKLFGILSLKRKGKVIYNGIKKLTPKSFDEIFKLNKEVINIVTIGELHSNKNYPLVLAALEKLPEDLSWNYHIIGDSLGDDSEKQKLHKLIIQNKYSDKIFMHGFVKDAAQYLENFDIFVLGSITESFGFVLAEAGLAKIPCIATHVGGVPEVIDTQVNGLIVESQNIIQMKHAIEKLITDENLRLEYGEKFYTKVVENFSYEKMINETIVLYEKV